MDSQDQRTPADGIAGTDEAVTEPEPSSSDNLQPTPGTADVTSEVQGQTCSNSDGTKTKTEHSWRRD